MLTSPYKNSKNKVNEFIYQAEKNRQYFENIRLQAINFKSSEPKIYKQIIYQFFTLEKLMNGLLSIALGLSLGSYFNIPILLAILNLTSYVLLTLFFSIYAIFTQSSQQQLFDYIKKTENELQNALLSISHLGIDNTVILQRICNQNTQFASFLKYYHQFEEMLKLHREDLKALLKYLKKDVHLIQGENIEEKLDMLKKLKQEIDQSILLLKVSKTQNKNSTCTSSLIEKSIFALKKHSQGCKVFSIQA